MTTSDVELDAYSELPRKQSFILLTTVVIVAMCGIVYELIIGTVSSYLLGNSVYQFSMTIGFFMFAMGVGSYASRYVMKNLIQAFIHVELILALLGGLCSISLFLLFPAAPWMYITGKYFFILSIGFLVGLEIPILTRVLAERTTTRESLSDVLSLDYIGALGGSVLFPLLLLPSLGLITASFAVGLVNASVALVNVMFLREHLANPNRSLALVGLVTGLLFFLTLVAGRLTGFAQDHLYFDQVVWKKQSQYQSLVVTNNWQKNDIRLFIDGHLQFSETDEYRYHEALVHPVMTEGAPPAKVLILGGGDGLAIREVLKHPSVTQIDLVDLDPAMTDLGVNFAPVARLNEGAMEDERVNVINADAFSFIRETRESYDRVIIDFPDPHNEALAKLYSVEFYTMVSHALAPGGAIVTQSSSPFFARNTYWTVGATLSDVFEHRSSFQISIPSFGVWGFHIAKMEDTERRAMPEGLRFMNDAILAASQQFPKDISEPDGLSANTIFAPTIFRTYADDMKG
jgi:spermidine synthase